jgi:site-specific recombinase XerD
VVDALVQLSYNEVNETYSLGGTPMNSVAKANVTRIGTRRNVSEKSVAERIETFLENKANKSKHTAIAYAGDIKQFFMFMCGKHINDLTLDDIIYSHTDVVDYQNYLSEQYPKGSTVNRKIASVKSMMEFLARDDDRIRIEVYNVDKMDENTDKYGSLSVDEWMKMCELVKSQEKGEEKSVLIELAGRTSIRLSALLSIKIDNIRLIDGVYAVDVTDKGNKKDLKAITVELFERMNKLAEQHADGTVFGLARNTIHNMMDTLCSEMNIPENRNIVFHSLKKVAINDILNTSGNIMQAQLQGNHSSANTTLKHYAQVQREHNLKSAPGLYLGKDIDLSVLDGMSAEQLLEVIKKLSRSSQSEILNVAKNLPH